MTLEPAFPVVGIGASAGGVEALTSFFHAVPADSGMAYVVVTHLGPGRESMLHDILARVARTPVERAVDGELLRPNHAYVLATAASLLVEKGRLRIRASGSRQQNPIDVCLASLAQDQGEHAIGVLLSGSGSDGTLGLKAMCKDDREPMSPGWARSQTLPSRCPRVSQCRHNGGRLQVSRAGAFSTPRCN